MVSLEAFERALSREGAEAQRANRAEEALRRYMSGHPCSDVKGDQCPTHIEARSALKQSDDR